MSDQRLEQIETRIAHLEYSLAQLDDTVIAQGAEIERLRKLGRELAERLRDLDRKRDAGGEAAPERPPHY